MYRAFIPRHFAVVGKVARPPVLCAAIVEEDALNVLLGNSTRIYSHAPDCSKALVDEAMAGAFSLRGMEEQIIEAAAT